MSPTVQASAVGLRQHLARGLDWPRPDLHGGEALILERRANWSRRGIARGGTLFVTTRRVIFTPNNHEASVGLVPAEWSREELASGDLAPRGWSPISGALRRRLRLTLDDGTVLLFVVEDPSSVLAKLDLRR